MPSSDSGAERLTALGWILAACSLAATAIGVFWMRLWLVGIVLGIAAVVVAVFATRRPPHHRGSLVASIAALAIALIPLGVAAYVNTSRVDRAEGRDLEVVLRAEIAGDFTVQRTVAPDPGTNHASATTETATDEYEVTYMTDLDRAQFFIAAAGTNAEATGIRCEVSINGVVVLTKSSTDRSLDCSFDPQSLYREKVAPE